MHPFLGVDLAWSEGRDGGVVNEIGLVYVDRFGHVLAADWALGCRRHSDLAAAGDQAMPLVVDKPGRAAAVRAAGRASLLAVLAAKL